MKERVALLTGGGDKPYALGMASTLTQSGIELDFIGSDELAIPELVGNPKVRFLNLRGKQGSEASIVQKASRISLYYLQIFKYAIIAKPRIFHLLWNNKFDLLDRIVLMLLYKVLGRKVVLTVHNVNAGVRDGTDSWMNRMSLGVQYQLADHLLVHTKRMKSELQLDFSVPSEKVSVIPFGINNTVPNTALSSRQAKELLGVSEANKALLFFGNIAPYKGLEHLVSAFIHLARADTSYRLIIGGRIKQREHYWAQIRRTIHESGFQDRVIERIEYIPDEEAEVFFKGADVLVLPYTHVFQSGVLFLGYNFGLPVVATDVGSIKEDVSEGETGFLAAPADPTSLAEAIKRYFSSELWRNLEERRDAIKKYANERYSWAEVGRITKEIYAELIGSSDVGKDGAHHIERSAQPRVGGI